PIHPRDADAGVPHGSDCAGNVQSVVAEVSGDKTGARGIRDVRCGDGGIGIVPTAIVGAGDCAASAERQRVRVADVVIYVIRVIRRDRRMVESYAIIHHRDEGGGTTSADAPGPAPI